jgi:hypothetical protein
MSNILRIYYPPHTISINGSKMTNTKVTEFRTYFKLAQVFCSCGGVYPYKENIERHYEDCPGAEGMKKIGYINDEGKEIYYDK